MYTWWDHIRNTEVRARTDQPAVSETIRHRRLAMLGRVSKMPSSVDLYRAVFGIELTGIDDPVDLDRPIMCRAGRKTTHSLTIRLHLQQVHSRHRSG